MKRPCEESSSAESDGEESIDVGRENTFQGHLKGSFIRCGSPTTPTQVMARKKRRGIIEKRRRDRINNSLSELRRLVPTAFEKQGSSKLEKAEILQMTVDHLKMMQATGGKGYFDAHALALDFLSLGFRECVTEVSRYLGAVEGLDPSDPLRLHLLSHLTACATQRDAAAAMTLASHHNPHPPHPFHPHHWASAFPSRTAFRPVAAAAFGLSASASGAPRRLAEVAQRAAAPGSLLSPSFPARADSTSNSASSPTVSSASSSSSSPSSLRAPLLPCVPTPLSPSLVSFPLALSAGFSVLPPSLTPSSRSSSSASPPTSSSHVPQSGGGSSKPYRPWGTEVGAF